MGGSSDIYYSHRQNDTRLEQQKSEQDPDKRKAILAQMQQLVYKEAPYIILYYDSELHAYRTDQFARWGNHPTEGGTPLFGYGSGGYTVLTDAKAAPSAA